MRLGFLLAAPSSACGQERRHGFALLYLAWLALLALALASPAHAEKGKLRERLTPDVMAVVYPGAERLWPDGGGPPAITDYRGDKDVTFIFSPLGILPAPGSFGHP